MKIGAGWVTVGHWAVVSARVTPARPQCCQMHGSKHRHQYQYTLYLRLQLNRIARHVVNIYFLLLEIFSLS